MMSHLPTFIRESEAHDHKLQPGYSMRHSAATTTVQFKGERKKRSSGIRAALN
jgi:hypothetical protein